MPTPATRKKMAPPTTAIRPTAEDRQLAQLEHNLGLALAKGKTFKDQAGVTDQQVDNTYALAHYLYSQKKYTEAAEIFRTLTLLDPSSFKYQLGFAACHHFLGNYNLATMYYVIAGELAPDNPLPYFHAGDCCQKRGDPVSAVVCYRSTLERIAQLKDQAFWQTMKDRCELLIDQLRASGGAAPPKTKKASAGAKKK